MLSTTTAHAFINLNFELALAPSNDLYRILCPDDPNSRYLDWSKAVPGWNHSSGNDTSGVYYGGTHLGTTQYYLLLDAENPDFLFGAPLEGNYSLRFRSGDFDLQAISVYTRAFVSQEGTIPIGTTNIQLLARGTFKVFFDENEIVMTEDENSTNLWLGDISAYQGQTGELKIIENAPELNGGAVVLDDIRFVPEPASYALFVSIGCLALLGSRHRTRRQRDVAPQDF